MRLKHLEASLSSLQREFADPKIELEQYPTCPLLAACVMDTAIKRDDIGNPGQDCLDLGMIFSHYSLITATVSIKPTSNRSNPCFLFRFPFFNTI